MILFRSNSARRLTRFFGAQERDKKSYYFIDILVDFFFKAIDIQSIFLQVWFQNRRAKWRKLDQTKKGPGRPAHNAHPQSCSGDPLSPEEIEKRERQRRQRKLNRQLEKKQAKLAEKGIHIDLATLKQNYQQSKDRGEEDYLDEEEEEELIDVVGSDAEEEIAAKAAQNSDKAMKKSFSIDSLLFSKCRTNS